MSRYDIRGMQARGMTTQQINDYIKQAEANMPKVIQDFRSQIDPTKVVAGATRPTMAPVKPPVKTPVGPVIKPPVKGPIKSMGPVIKPPVQAPVKPPTPTTPKPSVAAFPKQSIPEKSPSVPNYLQPGYTGLQGTPAPNAGPRQPGATNPIPQSILGVKKKGGIIKKMAGGGLAAGHKSADGIAKRGKTRAMQPKMAGGKGMKKGGYC